MTFSTKNKGPRSSSLPSRSVTPWESENVVADMNVHAYTPAYHLSTLATDFFPTVTEGKVLRARIMGQRNELRDLNFEMAAMRHRKSQLQARIDGIERDLDLHEALLAPSRWLPPEILGEIFSHCLLKPGLVSVRPENAPLLLMQVCRRWRRIAGETHKLWTELYLGRDFSLNPEIVIPLWMGNSGILPLDVTIDSQWWLNNSDPRRPGIEHFICGLLAQSIHRCRFLTASVSLLAIERLLGRDTLFAHLEKLEISWHGRGPPPIGHGATVQMANFETPRLQSIILDGTCFLTKGFRHALPLVKTLQLVGQEDFGLLSHSLCLEFIALCPNLKSCTLTLSKDPGGGLHSPVVLESLVHLHLIFKFSYHDPIPFLRALQTPRIERLTLQNHGGVSPVPHIRRALHLLLSARPHTIKELHLSSLFVPTSDWLPSFKELTALESLFIEGDSLDESFFEALGVVGPSSIWSCPQLTTLKLHHVTGLLGVPGDRLVAFIRSRSQSGEQCERYGGMMGNFTCFRSVSLMLCSLEHRHVRELQEIERQSGGSLTLHGIGTSER